jgi:hypothetical protein
MKRDRSDFLISRLSVPLLFVFRSLYDHRHGRIPTTNQWDYDYNTLFRIRSTSYSQGTCNLTLVYAPVSTRNHYRANEELLACDEFLLDRSRPMEPRRHYVRQIQDW